MSRRITIPFRRAVRAKVGVELRVKVGAELRAEVIVEVRAEAIAEAIAEVPVPSSLVLTALATTALLLRLL